MDEIGELDWVLDEEDGGVVAYHVVVSLLGVELEREASGVSSSISGTLFSSDGGEAEQGGCTLSNLVKERSLGVPRWR